MLYAIIFVACLEGKLQAAYNLYINGADTPTPSTAIYPPIITTGPGTHCQQYVTLMPFRRAIQAAVINVEQAI